MIQRFSLLISFRASRQPRRGFTLLEMLAVLAIMGIIAAVAVPKFANSLELTRVNSAAKRIVADLATAQARARMTSASQTVVFTVSPSASKYELVGMSNPDRASAPYTIALSQEPYYAKFSFVNCGGDTTIVFTGFGTPDTAGNIVVQVGSVTRTISINAVTGEATIL